MNNFRSLTTIGIYLWGCFVVTGSLYAQGLEPTPDADYNNASRYAPTRGTEITVKEVNGMFVKEVRIVDGPLPNLPPMVDLSEYAPPPESQSFNDCTAWAVSYCCLSTQIRQSRGISSSVDPIHLFSPRFVYSQINGGVDAGSYIYRSGGASAVGLLQDAGCSSMVTTPYYSGASDPMGWSRKPDNRGNLEAENYKIFHHAICENLDDVRYAILFGVPVVIACYTEPEFHQHQGSGLYRWQGRKDGRHAMCIIGYDNAKQAFRVQNSWGKGWGDFGRFWVGYDQFGSISGSNRGNGWCYEAHAIVADSSRGSQLRRTTIPASTHFFLPDGSLKESITQKIIAEPGSFTATEATNYFLYALEPDGTVMGLADHWYDLSSPSFPAGLGGGRARMMAASENFLYVITKAGNVLGRVPKTKSATGLSYWEKINLPGDRFPVDIRFRDDSIFVESEDGNLYKRQVGTGWELVN